MKLKDLLKDKVIKAKLAKLGFAFTANVSAQQLNTLLTILRGLGIVEAHKYSKKDGRDYEKERKFNDTPKARKYRAKLNRYNRDKGTYGNGDGRDASHSGGRIAGFEPSSKNKGRKEKSRLKKK
tara:strand:- start:9288 stop:9659 length:372 start_codon:yes stop_codon:yes gene_type:complete